MNSEIKEILEQLEWYRKIGKKDVYYPECVLPNKKAFLLLDYITNLQQEYDDSHRITAIEYKKRIDKAIEYIKEMLYPIGTCVNGSDLPYESIESLLNILQNGSEDNK